MFVEMQRSHIALRWYHHFELYLLPQNLAQSQNPYYAGSQCYKLCGVCLFQQFQP